MEEKENEVIKGSDKKSKKKILSPEEAERKRIRNRYIVSGVMLLISTLLFCLLFYLKNRYADIKFDQIIYQLKASLSGANSDLSIGEPIAVTLFGIGITAVELLIYLVLSGRLSGKINSLKLYVKYKSTKICKFFKEKTRPISAVFLIVSLVSLIFGLDVIPYFVTTSTDSTFIEENYVAPSSENIIFPAEKRNVIFIFLESYENTFSDPNAGGLVTDNFMKELTDLAEDNISFSHTDGIGGALSFDGTTWTASALVAQTSGLIIKTPIFAESYDEVYMPELVSMGDILEKQGYNQTFLVGSNAKFGSRDKYFKEHGNFEILDFISVKEKGWLEEDYVKWWGFEDEKLFEYAKMELTRLASEDKPFNLTLLTADSHFPDGCECRLCEDKYESQYANVLACSARQVVSFVNWIQEQPFYENTTIVISGDHLTMDPNFLEDVDPNYVRTTYNCFINSAVTPKETKNRLYGTFDIFPTTLAAMGVEIKGNRLALGTNLFSEEKTLTEIYGFEYLNEELQKKSEFYNETFFGKEDSSTSASK